MSATAQGGVQVPLATFPRPPSEMAGAAPQRLPLTDLRNCRLELSHSQRSNLRLDLPLPSFREGGALHLHPYSPVRRTPTPHHNPLRLFLLLLTSRIFFFPASLLKYSKNAWHFMCISVEAAPGTNILGIAFPLNRFCSFVYFYSWRVPYACATVGYVASPTDSLSLPLVPPALPYQLQLRVLF